MNERATDACALCGTPGTRLQRTTLDLARGDVRISISGIPAYHCAGCDDDAFDGPLSEAISEAVESIVAVIERYDEKAAEVAAG